MFCANPRTFSRLVFLVVFCGLFVQAQSAEAAPKYQKFRVPLQPGSIDTIRSYVEEGSGGPADNIPANLEEAFCGGWDFDQEIGDALGGKIADTNNLPGRKGSPLANPALGMAVKDDDFIFPDRRDLTCGFTSACRPRQGGYSGSNRLKPPFFANNRYQHPCDRPLDGIRADDCPDPKGNIAYSCGGGKMADVADDEGGFCEELQANWPGVERDACIDGNCDYGDLDCEEDAGGMCQKLNEDWVYTLWRRKIERCVVYHPDRGFMCGPMSPTDPDFVPCVWEHVGYRYLKGGCRAGDENIGEPGNLPPLPPPTPEEREVGDWEPDDEAPIRYCCTDQQYQVSPDKNCVPCAGVDCRRDVTIRGIRSNSWRWIFRRGCGRNNKYDGSQTRKLYSFFRHHVGSYFRDPVIADAKKGSNSSDDTVISTKTDVDEFDDHERLNVPVACYGIWKWSFTRGDLGECTDPRDRYCMDPLFERVRRKYFNCVIAVYYKEDDPRGNKFFFRNDASDEEQMEWTQAGRGDYKNPEPYPDPPDDINDPDRPNDPEDGGIWKRDLAKSFSLINDKTLKEDLEYDITIPLLSTDHALQRSTVQFTVDRKMSTGSLIRGFDETAATINQQSTINNWWQKIETKVNLYLTPPIVRLTLPPAWSVDLNPLQPLLTPEPVDVNDPRWQDNPLMQPINVQLEMREDLLDEVSRYLEEAIILQYQPEIIPIVVPTGSAVEYRNLAHGWCQWYIWKEAEGGGTPPTNCDGAPAKVTDMIDRLNEYADTIDKARMLRGQSAKLFARYLQLHTKMQEKIGQWVIDNTEEYLAYQDEWQERLELQEDWQDIQKEFREFHEDTNMPWCMNQRYTLPVYSLLDPWFPLEEDDDFKRNSRMYKGEMLDGRFLPDIESVEPMPDIVFDITQLRLGTNPINMALIKPIELRLDEGKITPVSVRNAGDDIPEIPEELPEIPNYDQALENNMPKIFSGAIGPGMLSDRIGSILIPEFEDELEDVGERIEEMNRYYKLFWDSLTQDPKDYVGNKEGTEEDCTKPHTGNCVHVEQDLVERFIRMGSRPAIYLKEDFDKLNLGDFRNPWETNYHACMDEGFEENKDWVCMLFNPGNSAPRQGWRIETPKKEDQDVFTDFLRSGSFEDTLHDTSVPVEDRLPFNIDRKDVVPTFNIPEEIELFKRGGANVSSSSSSSST